MNEIIKLELDRDDNKTMKWLKKAVSKDAARLALQAVNNENGHLEAVDGFRLHATNAIENFPEGLHGIDAVTGKTGNWIVQSLEKVTFPDTSQIVPDKEPILEIGINPQYLIDALSGFDKGETVKLTFYSPNHPMEVSGEEKYAMIMPANLDQYNGDHWKPEKREEQDNEKKSELE